MKKNKKRGTDMEKNTQIITRKYNIVPCKADTKQWYEKCYEYTISDINAKIDRAEYVLKKKDGIENRDRLQEKIGQYRKMLDEMEKHKEDFDFTNQMIDTYTKDLVREAMESEARRRNYILSWAFATMTENGLQHETDFKARNKFISEMLKPAYRVKGSNKGSLFDDTEIENILGGYGTSFNQELTRKIKDSVNKGLLEGRVSLPSYKMDSPCSIAKAHMGFSHDYSSYEELMAHIEDRELKLYFDFGSPDKDAGMAKPTIARFRFNLGGCRNRQELLTTLLRVYSGEYQYCGSSIQFNKQGNKVMLNLSMEIPVRENILDPDTVVDIDLGVDIPAICTVENSGSTLDIGSKEDLLRIRTQLQIQRGNTQRNLVIAKGGHGRKKKLRKLETLKAREANFANTYLHMVSRKAVDFAVENHAGCIRLKNIEEYDSQDYLLKNMSYYKLCQQIEYKAAIQGISVVYAEKERK
jgi:hypothetical protein